jgi:hypothetical protein
MTKAKITSVETDASGMPQAAQQEREATQAFRTAGRRQAGIESAIGELQSGNTEICRQRAREYDRSGPFVLARDFVRNPSELNEASDWDRRNLPDFSTCTNDLSGNNKKSPAPPEGAGHSQGERRLLVNPVVSY